MKKDIPGPTTDDAAVAAWSRRGLRMENVLPLDAMGALRGLAPYYYEWLRHPVDDPWWHWADLGGKYARTHAAVLNVSGWYDDYYGPVGATVNFNGLLATRAAWSDKKVALVIGPWVHGVTSTGVARAGDRPFPDNAKVNHDDTVLDWMDHYLRGIDNGVDRRPPVRYYVMGADTWRDSQSWPPPSTPTPFYLGAAAPGKPGSLGRTKPKAQGYSAFVSDPAHPVTDRYTGVSGGHVYRYLAVRRDLLTFDSQPLAVDTEVTGPIDARLFIRCNCRDADLWVRLYDVAPNGAAWNEMNPGDDVQRASYRDLAKGRQLLRPGRIYEIDVNGPVTSNVFKKGHRIRIQVSGAFFPMFSRNLQTEVSESVSAKRRRATIRIYHDRMHPSQVVLPIVTR